MHSLRPFFLILCLSAACHVDGGSPAPGPGATPTSATESSSEPWENPGCSEQVNVVDTGLELSVVADLSRWEERAYTMHERITVRPTKPGSAITLFGTALVLGKASHGYAYDGTKATFCTGPFAAGDAVSVDVDYIVSESMQNFPAGNTSGIHVWKERSGPAVVGTFSSPFFASTWMLAPQSMPWVDAAHAGNVAADRVELEVVTPDTTWSVIGPGEAVTDGNRSRFSIDRAMPLYTVAFAASPEYVRVDGGTSSSGTELSAAVFSDNRAAASKRLATIERSLDWLETKIGAFPWSEPLTLAEVPQFPGGMEHTAGMWIGSSVIARGGGGTDGDYTAIHEAVHHWWGNDVRIADWPHVWLSEGFTEWTTVFAILDDLYPQGNAAMKRKYRTEAAEMSYPSTLGGRVPGPLRFAEGEDFTEHAPNLLFFYRYGAAFLEMINQRLIRDGKGDLVPVLRRWFAAKSGKAVTTEEFRDFLGGGAWQELFDQWAQRGPCPTLELGAYAYSAGVATLTVRRTDGADQLLDEVEVAVAAGGSAYSTKVAVPTSAAAVSVSIPVPTAPTAVAVDPKGLYILRLRGAPTWNGPKFANALP